MPVVLDRIKEVEAHPERIHHIHPILGRQTPAETATPRTEKPRYQSATDQG